jgi:hypothetical protein
MTVNLSASRISQLPLGVSSDYFYLSWSERDKETGESVARVKTFVKPTIGGIGNPDNISMAIDSFATQIDGLITGPDKKPFQATRLMLIEADMRATRGFNRKNSPGTCTTPASEDRATAYRMYQKILRLIKDAERDKDVKTRPLTPDEKKERMAAAITFTITDADRAAFNDARVKGGLVGLTGLQGQAYIGIAELVLKQLNDGENSSVSLAQAIEDCQKGREILLGMPETERSFFHVAKSYIIEAKLKALLTDNPLSDSALVTLLDKAIIDWSSIKDSIEHNKWLTDPAFMLGSPTPSDNIEEARQGMLYLRAWAMLEKAKLTAQHAKPPRDTAAINAEVGAINEALQLCSDAQTLLTGISSDATAEEKAEFLKRIGYAGKPSDEAARKILDGIARASDYENLDAIVTEADLLAKRGRLLDNDEDRQTARDIYRELAKGCKFYDIKALATAGSISMEIELAEFNWDSVNEILVKYFDPGAGEANLRYPFSPDSYSFMSISLLEAQLRDQTKRTIVEVNGTGTVLNHKGFVADYQLADCRVRHITQGIYNIKAVRDRNSLVDIHARARLENARVMALKSQGENSTEQKIQCFRDAIAELEKILTVVLKETPEQIFANDSRLKMEGSFYVALWGEWASNLEQIAWLENKNRVVVDSSFNAARAKYNELVQLCVFSQARYDSGPRSGHYPVTQTKDASGAAIYHIASARGLLVDLARTNMDTAKQSVDIIAANAQQIIDTKKAIDGLITNIEGFAVPQEIARASIRTKKLKASVRRMLLEALCKKLFYINKQRAQLLADAGLIAAAARNSENPASEIERHKMDMIVELYKQISAIAKTLLPTDEESESPLDDTTYPVLNMFGVNSVYMRESETLAAEQIIAYFKTYVLGKTIDLTYDMIDALANAARIKRDAGIRKKVIELTDKLIAQLGRDIEVAKASTTLTPAEKESSLAVARISLAKTLIWRARLKCWFYDEKLGGKIGDILLETGEGAKKVRTGAIADYEQAISLYNQITSSKHREMLFENAASRVSLLEELSLAQFIYANAKYKGEANASARVQAYEAVVKSIVNDILPQRVATDTSGFTRDEIVRQVNNQDKAARIRARLTLANIALSIADPLVGTQRTGVTAADAQRVCRIIKPGTNITGVNDVYAFTTDQFQLARNDIGALRAEAQAQVTDTELLQLGIDVTSVYRGISISYVNIALRDNTQMDSVLQRIDEGIKSAGADNAAVGMLTILRANILFWISKSSLPLAAAEYEKGFLLLRGKATLDELSEKNDPGGRIRTEKMALLAAAKYEGINIRDLSNYADVRAIETYEQKTGVGDRNAANALLDVVIAMDEEAGGSEYGALALRRKADLINSILNEKNDWKGSRPRFDEAIKYLCRALDILGRLKDPGAEPIGTDTAKQVAAIARSSNRNTDKAIIETMCMLIESEVRRYNCIVSTELLGNGSRLKRAELWEKEARMVLQARGVVKGYLEGLNLWDAAFAEKNINTVIGNQFDVTDRYHSEWLKKVASYLAVLLESSMGKDTPTGVSTVFSQKLYSTDFVKDDLPKKEK